MKRTRFLSRLLPLLLAAVLPLASALATATPQRSTPRVTVDWTNPADFSDTRYNPGFPRERPEQWLGRLARYLSQRAERRLPPGDRLSVTFLDLQRAGIVEPWRGPQWSDIRIVKDPYSPWIKLRFTLTDADGRVLDQGERTLRDPLFLHRAGSLRGEPLGFEKRLLDTWLRREFPAPGAPR